MSGIRGKDTKPELAIRHALHRDGFRFRLHVNDMPGRPDIVLPKWHAVVQVNGCFWHGHQGCRYFRVPSTRTEFWEAKIADNRRRDAAQLERLQELGWRVATIWECAIRADVEKSVRILESWVTAETAPRSCMIGDAELRQH